MLQVSLQSVELKSQDVDLVSGLKKSPSFDWLQIAIDSADLIDAIRKRIPTDKSEVVDWMHYAAADNAVFEGFAEEYGIFSSGTVPSILIRSGDGHIPGVGVAGIRAATWSGSYVRRRGYTVVYTPRGSFVVHVGSKALFAMGDILAWAALPFTWCVQYLISLLRWLKPAKPPIRRRIRFPSSYGKVAPNFFSISPRVPAPICIMKIGITSNKPQRVIIRGRGTEGAYQNVLFSDSFNVDKGQSEVIYYVTGFPSVPSFTLELQPQDGTKTVLDYLETFP